MLFIDSRRTYIHWRNQVRGSWSRTWRVRITWRPTTVVISTCSRWWTAHRRHTVSIVCCLRCVYATTWDSNVACNISNANKLTASTLVKVYVFNLCRSRKPQPAATSATSSSSLISDNLTVAYYASNGCPHSSCLLVDLTRGRRDVTLDQKVSSVRLTVTAVTAVDFGFSNYVT